MSTEINQGMDVLKNAVASYQTNSRIIKTRKDNWNKNIQYAMDVARTAAEESGNAFQYDTSAQNPESISLILTLLGGNRRNSGETSNIEPATLQFVEALNGMILPVLRYPFHPDFMSSAIYLPLAPIDPVDEPKHQFAQEILDRIAEFIKKVDEWVGSANFATEFPFETVKKIELDKVNL